MVGNGRFCLRCKRHIRFINHKQRLRLRFCPGQNLVYGREVAGGVVGGADENEAEIFEIGDWGLEIGMPALSLSKGHPLNTEHCSPLTVHCSLNT